MKRYSDRPRKDFKFKDDYWCKCDNCVKYRRNRKDVRMAIIKKRKELIKVNKWRKRGLNV